MRNYVEENDIKTATKNEFYKDTSPKYAEKVNAVVHLFSDSCWTT